MSVKHVLSYFSFLLAFNAVAMDTISQSDQIKKNQQTIYQPRNVWNPPNGRHILYAPWRKAYQDSHNKKIINKQPINNQSQKPKIDVFCRLILDNLKNDKKNLVVKRFPKFYVALPSQPYCAGPHHMVIPNKHVDELSKLDDATLTAMQEYEQHMRTIFNTINFITVVGTQSGKGSGSSQPHVHTHIVPYTMRKSFTSAERDTSTIQGRIKNQIHKTYSFWNQYEQPSSKITLDTATKTHQTHLNQMYDMLKKLIDLSIDSMPQFTDPFLNLMIPMCHRCNGVKNKTTLVEYKDLFVAMEFDKYSPGWSIIIGHKTHLPQYHDSASNNKQKKAIARLTKIVCNALDNTVLPTGKNISDEHEGDHLCKRIKPRFTQYTGFIEAQYNLYVVTEPLDLLFTQLKEKISGEITKKLKQDK